MFFSLGFLNSRFSPLLAVILAVTCVNRLADAQEPAAKPVKADFTAAIDLLPDSVAGLVRVPNLPRFCDAWKKTHAGQLMEEPVMQPFIEAQRARAKNYLESIGNKIGIQLEELYEIGSGEAVLAWLPFESDERRPYALALLADVRGRKVKADAAMDKVDADLKAGGWNRTDITHRGQTVRVYKTVPKPGQLKVEEIVITLNDTRIIAADRDSVVTDLLDAIAGEPKGPAISSLEEFKSVLSRSAQAIRPQAEAGGGTIAVEWFAKPFQMGRIVRKTLDVDRGNQVDIIKLLENQGFDAIKAAGGVAIIAGAKFDVLHKGFILAPPTTKEDSKYKLAARMMQFVNQPLEDIPSWIHKDVGAVTRLNLRIEQAFWATETLVNEAFGDEIFRDIIDGIREDEDGPQIDIQKNVLPNLDDRILLVTDNTLPVEINSERMLVAIQVKDGDAIKAAIRKAMEVEPDASKMDVLPGVEIWRVQRGEGEENFDAELFGDLKIEGEEVDDDDSPPLLDHWAIGLVEKGPKSKAPYLMFSSHPEFLVETARRVQKGAQDGLGTTPDVKVLMGAIKKLGGDPNSLDRVVRTRISMRAKYELLRQGKLKDSDSILSSLFRRIAENDDGGQPDPLNAAKLPPLAQIEQHFPAGSSYMETVEDGWSMTGFYLK